MQELLFDPMTPTSVISSGYYHTYNPTKILKASKYHLKVENRL